MKLIIPLIPPSVNAYVRHTRDGRHYVTAEAKAFKEAIAILARGERVAAKRYQVNVAIFLGKGQKLDLDNAKKVIWDGLKEARIIHSDAAVDAEYCTKGRDWSNPRTEIEVLAL